MKTNRIPLVVGVTGHRNLREEDKPQLKEKVREILTDLKTRYARTPLLVLSSLAEGADQLVAQIALDCGIRLIVPLPMPVEEYRKDFAPLPWREFSDLLERADASFVLPCPDGVTVENLGLPLHRDRQYAMAGHYILRHCHILVALWDGDTAEKTGGTSQIVRQKLSGFPMAEMPEWTSLNPPDSGTVFHLVTPRKSNPDIPRPFRLEKYYADPRFSGERENGATTGTERNAGKIFESLLERTDTFNADVAHLESSLGAQFERSRAALEPDVHLGRVDENLKALLDRFAAADVLAGHFQKKRRFSLALLCFLAFESPVCLAAYHTVDAQHAGVGLGCLAVFFVTLSLAFGVYSLARGKAYETKHLDYRALAEGLKILFFWRMAGLHDDVGAQYLRKHRSDVDWIRLAVRASDLLTSLHVNPIEPYSWIKTQWMEDQLRYFDRSSIQNGLWAERCELAARVLVKAGVVMAAFMLGVHLACFHDRRSLPEGFSLYFHFLSVVIVGSLAGGGSITAYAEKLAFVQQSKQYGKMRHLFALAVKECGACLERGETAHARAIIRRLGHEALRENGDWVLLHRERPMEVKLG